jgi:Acetyltransferase (GNAT) domain
VGRSSQGGGRRHLGRPAPVSSPAPRELWREVYESDPHALIYHSPSWSDVLCDQTGYEDASRLYVLPDRRLAVLPLVRRRALGTTLWEASYPPAWGEGGLIATGGVGAADLAAMFADLGRVRAGRISLRPNPLMAPAYERVRPPGVVTVPRLAHVLDLAGGFDHVWRSRFTGTARTAVRKAERSGVTVEHDGAGRLLPVYYRLYEHSLDRWSAQQHEPRALARWRGHRRDPLPKLQAIAGALGERYRVWLAHVDGRPAAGIVVVRGPSATYVLGAMVKELAGPTRANYLLHRLAIEDACSAGCRYYHMGESGESERLAQFKTRFGATAAPSADYHVDPFHVTAADRLWRTAVKRVLGFMDAPAIG